MSATARYAEVLRTPQVATTLAAAQLARFSLGVYGLAMLLFMRQHTGTYAAAGAVAAAYALGNAIGSPWQGRLIDRHGQGRVMVPLTTAHGLAMAALTGSVLAGGPLVAAIAAALVAGAAFPPTGSAMRALWPGLLAERAELVGIAFALDSALVEIAFVIGPVLVSVAVALASPVAALALGVVLQVGGTLAFVATEPSRAWQPHPDRPHLGLLGALSTPGMRTIIATTVPAGACIGAIEVTLPAFADAVATRAWSGVLISVWSLASGIGALVFGARSMRHGLGRTYPYLTALLIVGTAPLALGSSLPVMVALLVPAGMAIGPMLSAGNQIVPSVAPAGAVTEAYTWCITALTAGLAAGSALAGAIVSGPGWRESFLAATAIGMLAVAAVFARRSTLAGA